MGSKMQTLRESEEALRCQLKCKDDIIRNLQRMLEDTQIRYEEACRHIGTLNSRCEVMLGKTKKVLQERDELFGKIACSAAACDSHTLAG